MDDPKPKLPALTADAPITRANLAQALSELMLDLPDGSKAGAGDLYINGGFLAVAPKE